ncbi:hypothetical protein [Thalassobacillus sp. CUG 92003]|uniref:hypothetical protein n=1 Tax=Thalassobacillus sp. CUG 92003 TaxID=2736641 RepID=UPI0015E73065|nr:hypothetical protein [Thalassobacillus sp. CUG 92003]
MYKYYALIGTERYVHKTQIDHKTYKRFQSESFKSSSLETINGRLNIAPSEIIFIEFTKEVD